MKEDTHIITGVLQTFNKQNSNGRIYSEDIFKRELKKLEIKYKKEQRQKKIKMINDRSIRES